MDPKGSILATPDSLNDDGRGPGNLVEGIGVMFYLVRLNLRSIPLHLPGPAALQCCACHSVGYDFIPSVLDRDAPDLWVKTGDAEAFRMARRSWWLSLIHI